MSSTEQGIPTTSSHSILEYCTLTQHCLSRYLCFSQFVHLPPSSKNSSLTYESRSIFLSFDEINEIKSFFKSLCKSSSV